MSNLGGLFAPAKQEKKGGKKKKSSQKKKAATKKKAPYTVIGSTATKVGEFVQAVVPIGDGRTEVRVYSYADFDKASKKGVRVNGVALKGEVHIYEVDEDGNPRNDLGVARTLEYAGIYGVARPELLPKRSTEAESTSETEESDTATTEETPAPAETAKLDDLIEQAKIDASREVYEKLAIAFGYKEEEIAPLKELKENIDEAFGLGNAQKKRQKRAIKKQEEKAKFIADHLKAAASAGRQHLQIEDQQSKPEGKIKPKSKKANSGDDSDKSKPKAKPTPQPSNRKGNSQAGGNQGNSSNQGGSNQIVMSKQELQATIQRAVERATKQAVQHAVEQFVPDQFDNGSNPAPDGSDQGGDD